MKRGGWGKTAGSLGPLGLTLPAVMLCSPAYAQTLGGGGDLEIPFVRIAAALVVGILIAIGAALLLKQRLSGGFKLSGLLGSQPSGRPGRQIKVHETHRLSPHADLCRFSVLNRQYLVIVSAHGTNVLDVSSSDTTTPPASGSP